MRAQMNKTAFVIMMILAGWAGGVQAEVAATVDSSYPGFSPLITNSGTPWHTDGRSYGWRFFVTKPITITDIGVFGMHRVYSGALVDDGLNVTHQMGVWGVRRASVGGGLALLRGPLPIGSGGTVENHYVYVPIEPLTITPEDPEYDRLLVGVWTGNSNTDLFYHGPVGAMTNNAQQDGAIQLQNYTYYYKMVNYTIIDSSAEFIAPWGGTLDSYHYFALNFKYSPAGAKADAGLDLGIYSSEQGLATVAGLATHTVSGTPMEYRWLEGATVLQDWASVGADGAANLNLAALTTALAIGEHVLTLEVKDAAVTASDTMVLTVFNTPPEAQPAPSYQVVEINVDAIVVTAEVADFDGDELSYQWLKGGEVIASGTVDAPALGAVVAVPDLALPAGDPRFALGINEVQLVVSDGANPEVAATATVEVKDTTAPTLSPTASANLLWPPNHQLCPVTIWATAADNGGGEITLTVDVRSNEAADAQCDGSTETDVYIDSVDNATGVIQLRLRAERAGSGDGRVYTIAITATDQGGNQSSATVEVRVPHDRRKK